MSNENAENSALDEEGFLKPSEESVDVVIEESEPPKKRGRGRPPKNKENIEAEKIEAGGKSASASKPTKKKQTFDAAAISMMGKQLVGIHIIVSQVTGLPELQISDPEGQALAQSIVNVAEQYNLSIDGKTGAALQLLLTAAMVYGPRAIAVNKRAKAARQAFSGTLNESPAN